MPRSSTSITPQGEKPSHSSEPAGSLTKIEIAGLRGYAEKQTLELAQPSGEAGSGLTIVVGANNAGKSTIVEAFHFLQSNRVPPAFTQSRRNATARGRVGIRYFAANGQMAFLGINAGQGNDVTWSSSETLALLPGTPFVVPSRRAIIETAFQNTSRERADFSSSFTPGDIRTAYRQQFSSRLVRMSHHRAKIDAILGRVLDDIPEWTVEPTGEHSQYAVRVYGDGGAHPIEGVGEGIISLLFIADALYDSNPGHTVVIDEPELSLHPIAQRRLAKVLAEFSSDRQIILASHSPYFADWNDVVRGAHVARVVRQGGMSRIFNLSRQTVGAIASLARSKSNPHLLGLDAREVFFLNDGVILVEGQEDVVGYRIIAAALNTDLGAEFYGWGVGGAGNIASIAAVLRDLGFRRVVGILDKGMEEIRDALKARFPSYSFIVSASPDVRTKPAQEARAQRPGLLDEEWCLLPSVSAEASDLLQAVKTALR